jgi:hypothetical protein
VHSLAGGRINLVAADQRIRRLIGVDGAIAAAWA